MIWIHYGLIVGSLTLIAAPLSNAQVPPQSRVAISRVMPPAGMAIVEGLVLDATSRKPVASAIVMAFNQKGGINGRAVTQNASNADGSFLLILDPKQTYLIRVAAYGYEGFEERLAFTSPSADRLSGKLLNLYRTGLKPPLQQNATTIETKTAPVSTSSVSPTSLPEARVVGKFSSAGASDEPTAGSRVTPPKTLDAKVVYTPPLVVAAPGKITQLRAIQFVQSKAELLPDAQPALEQLAAFLKNNPTAEIELAGHTDNQGDFDENVSLSKQRVEVVKAYLVTNGIAAGRITTRGYGPTRPIGSNNAESTRQLNRRVEMTVLKR